MKRTLKVDRRFVPLFIFIFAYVALSLFLPADTVTLAKYGLSDVEAKLLGPTIVVPFALIWWALFNGYIRLTRYARSIKGSPDGKGMASLAYGAKVFAYGLPLSANLNLILSFLAQRNVPFFSEYAMVINNYFSLLKAFVAFLFFQKGSYQLLRLTKKVHHLPEMLLIMFILLATIYSYITFHAPQDGTGIFGKNVYALPSLVVLFSVVAPYTYTWYKGISAVYNINFYRTHIQGKLYKSALGNLASGFTLLIVSSVFGQFVTTIANRLSSLKLGVLLPLVYLLLLLMGVGYLLISSGAKRLLKIEEVT